MKRRRRTNIPLIGMSVIFICHHYQVKKELSVTKEYPRQTIMKKRFIQLYKQQKSNYLVSGIDYIFKTGRVSHSRDFGAIENALRFKFHLQIESIKPGCKRRTGGVLAVEVWATISTFRTLSLLSLL